jgi:GMP reductase
METDEDHGSDTSFYSLGISDSEFDRLNAVNKQVPITRICIDVANGYMAQFYDFIKLVREFYPYATIMAGNVVTPEAVIALYDAGADIAKMGIGPGAVCTTRIVTGVGYPQLSCILDSFAAADSVGIGLCSDGGCTSSGDVSKAIVAGADFVMLGTMLAGTTEGGGTVDEDGNITFYGMSSETANNKHFGGLKNYRSSEGRTISIPHKGSMNEVISQVLGGVVSSCTYTGSLHLSNLPANGQFVRVNNVYNRSVERYTVGN